MANPLSAAGLKSGFLYLLLLFLVASLVIYDLYYSRQSVASRFHRQAFQLNYSAFKTGVDLAKIKFILQAEKTPGVYLDVWQDGDQALDYNRNGLPIGTSIKDPRQQTALSSQECIEVWQFVLGPTQPAISDSAHNTDYWSDYLAAIDEPKLNQDRHFCRYRSIKVADLQIIYHPLTGKIVLLPVKLDN